MEWMKSLLMIVQIIAAIGVIGLVLVQQGKGADMGAAFGSGASGSIFGATGSSNFLSKTTGILAAVFFVSTLLISYLGNNQPKDAGVLSKPGIVMDAEKVQEKAAEVKPSEDPKEANKNTSSVPK
jgi:preprotein translocase subunit SecG